MSSGNDSARKPAADKKSPAPQPKPPATPAEPRKREWDGSVVIREDIFGNKWASS